MKSKPVEMKCTAIGIKGDLCREFTANISGTLSEVSQEWVKKLETLEGWIITEVAIKDVQSMIDVFAKSGITTIPVSEIK